MPKLSCFKRCCLRFLSLASVTHSGALLLMLPTLPAMLAELRPERSWWSLLDAPTGSRLS